MRRVASLGFVAFVLVSSACKIELYGGKDKDRGGKDKDRGGTFSNDPSAALHEPPAPHDPSAIDANEDLAPSTRSGERPAANTAAPAPPAPVAPVAKPAVAGCGVITPAPASDACGTCLVQKCCAEGRVCELDGTCKSCVARGAASLTDSTCRANTLYQSVHACVNGPCTIACNGGGGKGSGGGAGGARATSCNQTRCSDGPAGNATCKSRGCGNCSFGACLMF